MREFLFKTKGHHLKGDAIRERIKDFLDAVPDIEKACEMLHQEQSVLWEQSGKRGETFLHQCEHPPYQILGSGDVDGETRKIKSVTLSDEDFHRLRVLSAVSGFSKSRLVRLAIAGGKLVMRRPIVFDRTPLAEATNAPKELEQDGGEDLSAQGHHSEIADDSQYSLF